MKRLIVGLAALCLCAQTLELVPLTATETATLARLQDEYDRAGAEVDKALKIQREVENRMCAAQAAVKVAHSAANETSGSCGGNAWTTTTSATGYRSRWEFDKDFKYLVHLR